MNQTLRQIFTVPAVVAVISLVGLLSALVGDGLWDVLSWLALGLAVVLAVRYGFAWRGRGRRSGA